MLHTLVDASLRMGRTAQGFIFGVQQSELIADAKTDLLRQEGYPSTLRLVRQRHLAYFAVKQSALIGLEYAHLLAVEREEPVMIAALTKLKMFCVFGFRQQR